MMLKLIMKTLTQALENNSTIYPSIRNSGEIYHSVSKTKYDFGNALKALFSLDSLEGLHHACKDLDPFVNADLGRDSHSEYHKIFYRNIKIKNSPIRVLWERFCKEVVKNNFPDEQPLIIQALPNLRIQVPGALAVHRWHCDSDNDHRHPLGEINAILAVTDMVGTNSVWRESSPNKGDFQPFKLSASELVYWNGNTCIHGNKKNTTQQTRISLNFRVIPTSAYNKNVGNGSALESVTTSTKFKIGDYYHCI
tara:strand:+ start:52 stop:807 length:756 start_codon:yes stop_codon:yes gene_type:complete